MMVYEEDGLQLPSALRMAANSGRERKFVVENEEDGMHRSPAPRDAVDSARGRNSILVNEEKDPLLPPALRIAANSGLGKKKKKHDDRMVLKIDAKAMRLRLAKTNGKTDGVTAASIRPVNSSRTRPSKSISMIDTARTRPTRNFRQPIKSRSIDTSRTRPTKSFRPTKNISMDTIDKSCGNWGKYSNEILNKKIKKVKKMLSESTPGSREFKSLNKKLIEYRAKLKEQRQSGYNHTSMNESLKICGIEAKESAEEQDHSDSLSEESVEDESGGVHDTQIEGRLEKKEVQDAYSLEMLKKKLKKLEKMLRKSMPGSKEYKKLQKKRTEYESQIKGQDANDNIADEKERENRFQQSKQTDAVHEDIVQYQPGLSWQRAVEDPEPTPSLYNYHTQYGHDEKLKKQAYLEEARQLKRDALEKKRKTKEDEESRNMSSSLGKLATEESQSESSEGNEVSKYVFADQNSQRKKQAYLEEARQLKREALEKKKKEEEIRKKAESRESSISEESNVKDSHESIFTDTNEHRKKKVYLEEARQLKRDILEKKGKEEELRKEENEVRPSPEAISTSENIRSKHSDKYEIDDDDDYNDDDDDDDDDRRRKQAYLEEARRLKQEALLKRSESQSLGKNEENLQVHSSVSTDLTTHRKRPNFLDDIESEVVMKKEKEQRNDDTSISKAVRSTGKSNIFEHIKFEPEVKKEDQHNDSTSSSQSAQNGKPPKFLAEIKSKRVANREDEQNCDSAPFSQSPQNRKPPSFLAEIKSKACGEKEEKQQDNSAQSSKPVAQRKKSFFLNGIISKAKGGKDEKRHSNSTQSPNYVVHKKKPNFLNEIISKAKGVNKEKRQDTFTQSFTQSTDSTTHQKNAGFLDEIKSKATVTVTKEEIGQGNYTRSSDPTTNQLTPPSFLDEIKSKGTVTVTKEELGQGNYTQSSDPTTNKLTPPSFLDEIKSKRTVMVTKEGIGQVNSTQSSNPTTTKMKPPSFLNEIKSKSKLVKVETRQGSSTPSIDPTTRQKKPSLLDEIKSKIKGRGTTKNEEPVESTTPESSVLDYGLNTESVEMMVQQPEQADENGARITESPKEETAKATPNEQQQQASKDSLDRRTLPQPLSNNSKKILRELESNELRQKKLERSLIQNGISITEEIPYEVAKDKIAEITESMKALVEGGMESYTVEKEYFRLEEQLSKFTTALMLTDKYAEEVQRLEQDWEETIQADNIAAIHKLRSHMPINIRHLTEEQLVTTGTPNGKTLPRPIARKFKRTNILQLLRVDPDDIEMMHPSLLEGTRTTSLTLTERRALHEHLRDVVERWTARRADPSIEKKWQWYQSLKFKFKETLSSYSRGDKWTIKADAAVDYDDDYGYTKEALYESSGRSESKKESPREASQSKGKSSEDTKSSELDILQEYRTRLRLDTDETEVDKNFLRELFHSEKRTKSLEKQLTQAGLSLPKEDISYDVGKRRITELTEELNKVVANMGNTVDKKQQAKLEQAFGSLSKELDKYTNAMMLTKEWAEEQKQKEQQWETDISAANYEALQKVLRHMPVNVRNVSEASLATDLSPNGKVLPKAMGRKFKRTNILMILRTDPSAIESMHPSSLEAMRTTGLTLTERRAIHEHLKGIAPRWKAMAGDKMCERKWMWHASLQSKLKEMLANPTNIDDYSGDYGYPDTPEYEQQAVAKSNLMTMEELEKRRHEEDW